MTEYEDFEDFEDWWLNYGHDLIGNPKLLAHEAFKAGADNEKEKYEERANNRES